MTRIAWEWRRFVKPLKRAWLKATYPWRLSGWQAKQIEWLSRVAHEHEWMHRDDGERERDRWPRSGPKEEDPHG